MYFLPLAFVVLRLKISVHVFILLDSALVLSCYNLFLKLLLFIYLCLAVLGLCCCARAFSSCGEQGLLFIAVHGLLIGVAPLVAEHGF